MCSILLWFVLLTTSLSASSKVDNERLTLTEARNYLLELVNRDRAVKSLKPVDM